MLTEEFYETMYKDIPDKELVCLIYKVDPEFAGETLFWLIKEACKRNLTLTFKDDEIVYNRC